MAVTTALRIGAVAVACVPTVPLWVATELRGRSVAVVPPPAVCGNFGKGGGASRSNSMRSGSRMSSFS